MYSMSIYLLPVSLLTLTLSDYTDNVTNNILSLFCPVLLLDSYIYLIGFIDHCVFTFNRSTTDMLKNVLSLLLLIR